jgi:hypothetical protein
MAANHSLEPTPRTARFAIDGSSRGILIKIRAGPSGAAQLKAVSWPVISVKNYD